MARPFLLVLVLLLVSPALADTIFQPGGGKIVGEIVEEKDDYVAIRTRAGGILKIPRDEIDKIERAPVPEREREPEPERLPSPAPRPPAPSPVSVPPSPVGATPLKPVAAPGPTTLGSPGVFAVDEEPIARARARAVFEWFERRQAEIRSNLLPLLKARRKEALDFIMDPKRYPEENHGEAAQPDVDRLVAALRRVWEDPFAELVDASPELARLVADLDLAADVAPVRARVNKALALAEAPLPEHDQASVAYNARAKTTLDSEERACIDATNRYRLMFGLRALRADERLVQAARKHSRAMVERDFFDHTSPLPGFETPEKRCAAEGANYSAENIALGSAEGADAFHQWYTSSGHHRNLLGDHATIGVGRHESHWTQDFGKDAVK